MEIVPNSVDTFGRSSTPNLYWLIRDIIRQFFLWQTKEKFEEDLLWSPKWKHIAFKTNAQKTTIFRIIWIPITFGYILQTWVTTYTQLGHNFSCLHVLLKERKCCKSLFISFLLNLCQRKMNIYFLWNLVEILNYVCFFGRVVQILT